MSKTLQGALREFNIRIVPISQSYHRGARQTCAGRTLEHVFRMHGYDITRSTLMTFCETLPANRHAMVAPVILAVSDVLAARPAWFCGEWLRAMDGIDLGELFAIASTNRRLGKPRVVVATMLFERMRPHFPDQVRAGARRRRLKVEPELAEAA